jgi:hypothetical protein
MVRIPWREKKTEKRKLLEGVNFGIENEKYSIQVPEEDIILIEQNFPHRKRQKHHYTVESF